MRKFFGRSRALWAAMIPLIVALAALAGVDTENLAAELVELGTAVALFVSSGLCLASRFWPDRARLTGRPGALVLLLVGPLALGCAMVPNGPKVSGLAQAYQIEGQKVTVTDEGGAVCESPDPNGEPCSYQYAGSDEAGAAVLEVLAIPFEAVLTLLGRSLPGT